MSRGFSASDLAILQRNQKRFRHLVKMEFSTVLYLTTAPADVTYSSDSYVAANQILSIGDLSENVVPTVQTTNITLSGIESDNISIMLTEDFINVPVTITAVILDTDNSVLVAVPFKYLIQSCSFDDNLDSGKLTVNWTLTSHWSNFDRVAGRWCNSRDQQYFYSGDTFFKSADQPLRSARWGQK